VLISQNRADAKRQVIADEQWRMVKEEGKQNVELLDLSRQILALTEDVHSVALSLADCGDGPTPPAGSSQADTCAPSSAPATGSENHERVSLVGFLERRACQPRAALDQRTKLSHDIYSLSARLSRKRGHCGHRVEGR
jgi:hypothetical protein